MLLRSVTWAAITIGMIAALTGNAVAVPNVRLIDQRGRTFSVDSLRGAPLVVTFVSAHCNDACPIVEARLADAVDRLRSSPLALTFLTVTLDPERDTENDMRRIARRFEADPARWIFATGSLRAVHALMHSFGIHIERDARGYASSHATLVYVLDSHLRLQRTLFPANDLTNSLLNESIEQ